MFKAFTLSKPRHVLTKLVSTATLALFLTASVLPPASPLSAAEDEPEPVSTLSNQVLRLSGDDRYATALAISAAGWEQANAVVLARGDQFPDALAGAVLAQSDAVKGPLLLTRSNALSAGVLDEVRRLGASKVYILGGTAAVSAGVEQAFVDAGIAVERVEGDDRYATAANIARKTVFQAEEAFIATGADYPDALSIASYAAAHHIPLLLTRKDTLPEATVAAIKDLGVKRVTLIGGENVISEAVKQQLEELAVNGEPLTVNRLYGNTRYETNSAILKAFIFDHQTVYFATGTDYPDALAGAATAATGNHPIVLLPKQKPDPSTEEFLSSARETGAAFVFLGGWNAISYSLENIIRTGVDKPRISLQYLQYRSDHNYQSQINAIPGRASDYVDIVAPNWLSLDAPVNGVSPGTFKHRMDESYEIQTVKLAHERGLRILPVIASLESSTYTDSLLSNPQAQARFINEVQAYLHRTGADGIVIDFEKMSDEMGDEFVAFMQSLYAMMKGENKLLVIAVPAKLKSYTWYAEYDYTELVKYCDYMNIMTYDYSYSTSPPGPIAPLSWVEEVLKYTATQVDDMSKILLGINYYGRNWTENKGADGKTTYSSSALNYTSAMALAAENGAPVQRFALNGKGVGVPYFQYTGKDGKLHHVYFEDGQSWEEKLQLLNAFGLGGVGCWSHFWIDDQAGNVIYPLLKTYLR